MCPLLSRMASTRMRAASWGKRYSPGKRRLEAIQPTSWLTLTRRVSMRPCPLSTSSSTSRLPARAWAEISGERARDLGQQVRLVLLHAQQVVGLGLDDRCRDRGIAGNGVNGDDCALERAGVRQSPQQGRDRHLLTGRVLDRLLAEHEAFVGRKGRDQVQRLAACAAVMAAA